MFNSRVKRRLRCSCFSAGGFAADSCESRPFRVGRAVGCALKFPDLAAIGCGPADSFRSLHVPLNVDHGGRSPRRKNGRRLPTFSRTRNMMVNLESEDGSAGLRSAPEASYSITSSARASSAGGIVRPSDFAVRRFSTSSKVVGWTTGRSPAFSPLRMRPT